MIALGIFAEMKERGNIGSIKNYLCDKVNYDKNKVIKYLKSFPHFAACPRASIDCVTGEEISSSFFCCEDGMYYWGSYLPYHIKKYNIKLPDEFIQRVNKV